MNILEFHQKLSSPDNERIEHFIQTSMLFNIINGTAVKEEDLIGIAIDEDKFVLEFTSETASQHAEQNLMAQVIPGVCGGLIYGILADRHGKVLNVKFIDL